MCDTMALPISTPKWPRRIRRGLTTIALLAGTLLLSWSIVEMADEGGVVAHIGGVEINATIDEQMMLNLRISSTDPRASTVDAPVAVVDGEEDYVYYDDEGEDDQMVDIPTEYRIAARGGSAYPSRFASK